MIAFPRPIVTIAAETITHRFARIASLSEGWQWLVLVLLVGLIAWYVVRMYRRDGVELPRPLPAVLMLLRLAAFAGILFYFFKLERRAEREVTRDSRVVLLVDTSQSMSLRDLGDKSGSADSPSRIESVTAALAEGTLIQRLREEHEVAVYRFDATENPAETALFPRKPRESETTLTATAPESIFREARFLARSAELCALLALIAVGLHVLRVRSAAVTETSAWGLLLGTFCLIAGAIFGGTAALRDPRLPLADVFGFRSAPAEAAGENAEPEKKPDDSEQRDPRSFDWVAALPAVGTETRLGDALLQLIRNERGGTTAAILPLTDGNRNAGVEAAAAIAAAAEAGIPLSPVAIGSDRLPVNVRVVDLEAPARVYPGDKFTIAGHVQAVGLPSGTLALKLFSSAATANEKDRVETLEQEQSLEFQEGKLLTVKFELEPQQDLTGVREFRLSAEALPRETELQDNQRTAKTEILDRKDKILLFAGGPTREFIFLRNQLFRDEEHSAHVTVLLQSAKPGIAQEAHEIIYEFPETEEELFQYDCIVAFDPDWDALDELQVKLLERFVGEQAGGLITVAGPVFTPQWSTRRDTGKLRTVKSLYPVAFYGTAASSGLSRFGSEKAWPVEFTTEGEEAAFLRLGDTAAASRSAWESFEGVYGYYAVKDPKPGAQVYARFADPDAKIDDQFPIYMAGGFFGAGRVFYLGSGEMWRVRAIDEAYFEEFYTKLIRWAAEGRLLRDSQRGVLLVDKDRCHLGDRVNVRAKLLDALHKPSAALETEAILVLPDGRRTPLVLKRLKEAGNEGVFTEQFIAAQEGDYRVEIAPRDLGDQVLKREVRVRLPEGEMRDPKRNDTVLGDLARRTGGKMLIGADSLRGEAGLALAASIEPKDQTTVVPGSPDKRFEERLMAWLIAWITGALSLEWFLRRLNKLA